MRAGWRISRPDQVGLILVVLACGVAAGDVLGPGLDLASVSTGPRVLLISAVVALVAVSVHAVNEYADAATDALTVRTRFSGGSGALSDHGLPASFALSIAIGSAGAAALATTAGLALGQVDPEVAALLGLGLLGGWQYSVGPLALSRRGWGEVANAVLGAVLLPTTGAVAVGAALPAAAAQFVPFALLDFVNLLETQWSDRVADRAVGKHTLASRLSAGALRALGTAAVVGAYALSALVQPVQVALAGLVALPLSAWGAWRLGRAGPGPSVAAMVVFLVAQGIAWALL